METTQNAVEDRGIGPEKLTVRVFREVFVRAALESGRLKGALEEYLKTVLENKSAKRSDKSYARKLYTDLIRQAGGNGLPAWATKAEESAITDKDLNEMLTGITFEEPAVTTPPKIEPPKASVQSETTAPDYINPDDLLDPTDVYLNGQTKDEPDPFEATLKSLLVEYKTKTTHPFVRPFELDGNRYVAVGTFVGNIVKGENAGKKLNVNFTVNPFRTRRDIPDDVLIHRGGRAVSAMEEDANGNRRFLFVVEHKNGRKLRFWTRVGEADCTNLGKYVILTEDKVGWKEVTRNEF